MKKVLYVLLALSLLVAFLPAAVGAHTADDPLVVDLLAGQTEDIGEVKVWNDADNLYVQFLYDGSDCGFLEVHLQVSSGEWPDDILTKKGNPIPGHFEYSHSGGCFAEKTFTINLADNGWACNTSLKIAAHAALGVEESMTFESNVGDTVHGPIYSDSMPTDWGTAGSAVQAYNWLGYTRDLSDPAQIPGCTTNPLSSLTWSWGFAMNPTYNPDIPDVVWISSAPNTEQWHVDSWRKFIENYDVPGYPIEGNLQVNADNYYVVSNGEQIGTDDDIFNGPETYTFYPMEGPNTLEFVTENWAQGSVTNYCDQLRNPNGVTYKGTVSYYADGETAWGCGQDNCTDFPGKNWATYFTYEVQCCTNVPEVINGGFESPVPGTSQGWDIYDSGTDGLGWTVEWYGSSSSYGGQTRPEPAPLELHTNGVVVDAWEGTQYAELDTDWDGPGSGLNGEPASVKIYQDLATCPGQTYTLKYAWRGRPGYESSLQVNFGDYSATHSDNSGQWNVVEVTAVAEKLTERLEFIETGPADSFGMFLDGVSVSVTTP
jgi:hypothetical protein